MLMTIGTTRPPGQAIRHSVTLMTHQFNDWAGRGHREFRPDPASSEPDLNANRYRLWTRPFRTPTLKFVR